MTLSLGFSPCPNDTFIFDALVNQKIDTEGLQFQPVLEDVQTLNGWAAEGRLDITKLSLPALFNSLQEYAILSSGSALGEGVGPLLIGKKMVNVPDVAKCRIAIPGENTTAHFLLRFAFPGQLNKIPMLFSEIEQAVLDEKVDLGVIIHENRFTYQQKGLHKICDLGEVWQERVKSPIPLGCIAVKRSLPESIQKQVDRLIRKSLEYAYKTYPEIADYVKSHSQEMDEAVMRKHIDLYVNDYSLDLKEDGRKAIITLFDVYSKQSGTDEALTQSLFISQ
ncbi:MAG TPA: 1,4-dihydroxy-6-naphthoate synthase [Flavisolibacter sp.]|jgi:1,4-dihydroxy-6-naphthoate synthase|nr:1,4-dihydroxy-6-naphthoate synthase [Flavisolibacter sp.]